MSAPAAAACQWREEGGRAAAGERSLAFIAEVGIPVRLRQDSDDFTQPITGLAICDGSVVIDPETEVWPGDLLHEAGHIAVVEPARRVTLGALEPDQDEEYMAIAWSYAAAKICAVGLRQLFHSEGYKGSYEFAATCYATGQFVGADGLAAHGMTAIDLHSALAAGVPTYPNMIRWLR
uniref:hypothetical protein n=1 Tax=Parerythrobacter lutipelagi TaxID=1964208 RepID=UPI0010F9ED8F|nr:hypothetical protein [Parerythrobacter lutipelagi]